MPVDHLAHLSADVVRVSRVLDAGPDLDSRVGACPDWALRDLVLHLGRVHRWATTVVLTGDRSRPDAVPVPDAALPVWFSDGARDLLTALDVDPRQPCWGFGPVKDVGFWQRRQAQETAVHRVDVERCVGDASPIDDALAEDGIAEVLEVLHPHQVTGGRAEPPTCSVQLTATTGGRWQLGTGPSCGTVTGPPAELLLLLWGRTRRTSPALSVTGDVDALDALLGGCLTP